MAVRSDDFTTPSGHGHRRLFIPERDGRLSFSCYKRDGGIIIIIQSRAHFGKDGRAFYLVKIPCEIAAFEFVAAGSSPSLET